MTLAVILLNWRDEAQTISCASAVKAWSTLAPRVVVVDNEFSQASTQALSAALSPDAPLASPVNLGYGGGINLGLRRALALKTKYILLLNTDAEVSESGMARLIETMQANPSLSIVGPVIRERRNGHTQVLIGGRDIARHAATRIPAADGELAAGRAGHLRSVDYVPGTVFLARAAVFEDVGPLDERYFFSGEIADFCRRAAGKGHGARVALDVEARHDAGHTSARLRGTLYVYYTLRNRFLYVRTHHAGERTGYFVYWTGQGAREFAAALRRRDWARARAVALALAHGLAGRFGNGNAWFRQ